MERSREGGGSPLLFSLASIPTTDRSLSRSRIRIGRSGIIIREIKAGEDKREEAGREPSLAFSRVGLFFIYLFFSFFLLISPRLLFRYN